MPQAFLLAVGSELLLPGREDTNTVFLRHRLLELGIHTAGILVVPDREEALLRAFAHAAGEADLIVTTGGLGPTEDDLTRQALARHLRRSMRYDPSTGERLEAFFKARGREIPEACHRQALVPSGFTPLPNSCGTAPGLWGEDAEKTFLLLPGPPREMEPMFEQEAAPRLRERMNLGPVRRRHLRVSGLPEPTVDELAAPIYQSYRDIDTTILCQPGDVELLLVARSPEAELDRLSAELEKVLAPHVYSREGLPLEAVVGNILSAQNQTLAVAESCTGGLLAKRLTDTPGSSTWFLGGAICYHNDLKVSFAGVPGEILEKHGAVSQATAAAMAVGIRRATGASAGVGITGVAGPGGGTPDKPVGLVWVGVCVGEKILVKKHIFHGGRALIRSQAAQAALSLLRRNLLTPADSPARESEA